jgi:asparagine synthase (glutamine-hydrolysing)
VSGFTVIFHLDSSPADRSLFERMLGAITHRGPDGIGRWVSRAIAIGHAKLATTPEAVHEDQPLRDNTLDLTLAFDGRVDNREELRSAIEAKGITLRGDTDAELVLRAYQCWGEESPRRILGDFAYAIWDGMRRRLFCARDPLGMKPFFYYCDGRRFLAGSELQQILEDPCVSRRPNEGFVAEYLTDFPISRDETLFEAIRRLSPGHQLIVRPQGLRIQRYFDIDTSKQIRYRTHGEYAEHLRHLLREAVRCRMRSPGGVAAELSGGVDSSSVVCVALALMRDGKIPPLPFETFSIACSEPEADERRHIDAVVRSWGIGSTLAAPRIATTSSCLDEVRRYKDVILYPSCVLSDNIRSLIAAKGFRVCLTGQGGDEWQTGTPLHFADLLRAVKLGGLVARLRAEKEMASADPLSKSYRPFKCLVRHGLWNITPEVVRSPLRRAFGATRYPNWLEPEFVRRSGIAERLAYRPASPRLRSLAQQQKYNWLMSGSFLLIELWERASARFGFELRHPLHDLRIVEFAIASPEEVRCNDGMEKYALRYAVKDVIPPEIFERRDKGDATRTVMRAFENLCGEAPFYSLAIASSGWVNGRRVREAHREMMKLYRQSNYAFARYTWPLFGLIGAELWFKEVLLANPARGHENSSGSRSTIGGQTWSQY